jgi:hypothetical protein
MDLAFEHLLPEGFDNKSKVWIYQCNRLFFISEALQIEELIEAFIQNWKSHGTPVKGFGTLLFGQFLVLIADETATGVSGCSTDSSVKLVKEIETLYQVNMFDRLNLAFIVNEKIQTIPFAQLQYAINNGYVNENTLYFNNTVVTLSDMINNWITPIKKSWIAKRLPINN